MEKYCEYRNTIQFCTFCTKLNVKTNLKHWIIKIPSPDESRVGLNQVI